MKTSLLLLLLALFATGLMAGIFFTWSNAVKPGIGRLDDFGYLATLQAMNRTILNPVFQALFLAAAAFPILAAISGYYHNWNDWWWMICTSAGVYFFGAFVVTLTGNIPLNRILDAAQLEQLSAAELDQIRNAVENKWNNFNLIRTISSLVAFGLLALVFWRNFGG